MKRQKVVFYFFIFIITLGGILIWNKTKYIDIRPGTIMASRTIYESRKRNVFLDSCYWSNNLEQYMHVNECWIEKQWFYKVDSKLNQNSLNFYQIVFNAVVLGDSSKNFIDSRVNWEFEIAYEKTTSRNFNHRYTLPIKTDTLDSILIYLKYGNLDRSLIHKEKVDSFYVWR